jgi:hypothetical protein
VAQVGKYARSDFAAPRMRFEMFREYTDANNSRHRVPFETDAKPDGLAWPGTLPEPGRFYSTWTASVRTLDRPLAEGESLELYVEEIDWRRPASYPDEPNWNATKPDEDYFVESGPRFSARLTLAEGPPPDG